MINTAEVQPRGTDVTSRDSDSFQLCMTADASTYKVSLIT